MIKHTITISYYLLKLTNTLPLISLINTVYHTVFIIQSLYFQKTRLENFPIAFFYVNVGYVGVVNGCWRYVDDELEMSVTDVAAFITNH